VIFEYSHVFRSGGSLMSHANIASAREVTIDATLSSPNGIVPRFSS
jgi:hypothetical protein